MPPRATQQSNPPSAAPKALAAVLLAGEIAPALVQKINSVGTEALAKVALKEGLAGAFLQAATRLPLKLNAGLEMQLRLQAMQTAAANLGGLRAFRPVAARLNQAGIPYLLLKGAALNLSIYARPDLRPMTDIDILVCPVDTGRVERLLVEDGCTVGRALVRHDFYPRYYYEREYHIPGPAKPVEPAARASCRLDVHAHPFRPLRYVRTVPHDAMWDRPSKAELEGIEVFYPSKENMLIHLAAHSAIHGDVRFLWLYDIIRLLKDHGDDIDFAVVQHKAMEWGLSLAVYCALSRAAELFDDQALAGICCNFKYRRAWQDRLALFQAPRDSACPIAHIATNLLTTPGVRFRLGYLWCVMFPGRTHMGGVYPWCHPGWLPCAYLWRMIRPVLRLFRSFLVRFRPGYSNTEVESALVSG